LLGTSGEKNGNSAPKPPGFFALVYYPAVDAVSIQQLRKKYDPQVQLIQPDITIVFPVPESIGEQHLIAHIQDVLLAWRPFTIRLKGLRLSWDNYLFLLVHEGKSNLIRLHAQMYVGLLAEYHHDEVSFVPHVTLGFFSEDDRRQAALAEAERLNLDYRSILDRLFLVKVNSDRTQVILSKEFLL
jgi:2'-5' RNA ligase